MDKLSIKEYKDSFEEKIKKEIEKKNERKLMKNFLSKKLHTMVFIFICFYVK